MVEKNNRVCCSFCGKHQDEVYKLIAGFTGFICDECVDLCAGIITEMRKEDASALRNQPDA